MYLTEEQKIQKEINIQELRRIFAEFSQEQNAQADALPKLSTTEAIEATEAEAEADATDEEPAKDAIAAFNETEGDSVQAAEEEGAENKVEDSKENNESNEHNESDKKSQDKALFPDEMIDSVKKALIDDVKTEITEYTEKKLKELEKKKKWFNRSNKTGPDFFPKKELIRQGNSVKERKEKIDISQDINTVNEQKYSYKRVLPQEFNPRAVNDGSNKKKQIFPSFFYSKARKGALPSSLPTPLPAPTPLPTPAPAHTPLPAPLPTPAPAPTPLPAPIPAPAPAPTPPPLPPAPTQEIIIKKEISLNHAPYSLPLKLKIIFRSNLLSRIHKPSKHFIAIQEPGKHTTVLPFPPNESALDNGKETKTTNNGFATSNKVVCDNDDGNDCDGSSSGDEPSFDSAIVLPQIALRRKKKSSSYDLRGSPRNKEQKQRGTVFAITWGCAVFFTALAVFFTQKYKIAGINMWRSSFYTLPSVQQTAALSLNNVAYTTSGNKITVVGEIVNLCDDSLPAVPLVISVKENDVMMFSWQYFPAAHRILPNEHFAFREEKEIPFQLRKDLQVELSFLELR
jgi:hypothetical protein